jgi:hypothetical protein
VSFGSIADPQKVSHFNHRCPGRGECVPADRCSAATAAI